jgi:nicotinate-nucleotide adenylyltransferase
VKLAIMGGTFNPVHIGHLVCGQEAVEQFSFDEILFMPAGLPPHKEVGGGVTAEIRYLMTEMATADNERFRVSRYEIEKKQTCYTVDTIRHFRQEMPDAEIFFITGADAILEILDWKDPQELLSMATLIAATRPGYSLDRLDKRQDLTGQGPVQVMQIPEIGVSSSMIRERVRQGRSIRYFVPDNVGRFIEKERLYQQA